MRINVYAEEISQQVEIVRKGDHTGLRFWLYLPVTTPDGQQVQGPFKHHADDDDSSAITFWGKAAIRSAMVTGVRLLDEAHAAKHPDQDVKSWQDMPGMLAVKDHRIEELERCIKSMSETNAAYTAGQSARISELEAINNALARNTIEHRGSDALCADMAKIMAQGKEIHDLKSEIAAVDIAIGNAQALDGKHTRCHKIQFAMSECARMDAKIKELENGSLHGILGRRDAELSSIDEALGNRGMFDGCTTRASKIKRLCDEVVRLQKTTDLLPTGPSTNIALQITKEGKAFIYAKYAGRQWYIEDKACTAHEAAMALMNELGDAYRYGTWDSNQTIGRMNANKTELLAQIKDLKELHANQAGIILGLNSKITELTNILGEICVNIGGPVIVTHNEMLAWIRNVKSIFTKEPGLPFSILGSTFIRIKL